MSVNITVNGRYTQSTLKHNLLSDPERVRKETENERRKLRLQQVRAVSKNIAKKVLNDVEMEKEKQLKKIEEIKEREMQMWRQNALEQQERNFRSAIFQIGTAHRAAEAENSKQAQTKAKKISKKHSKAPKLPPKVGKENVLKNANVQTDITGKCYPKPSPRLGGGTISKAVNEESAIATEQSASESDEDNSTTSTEFYQNTTSLLSDSVELFKPEAPLQSITTTKLRKTTPVSVEVHITTDTSQNKTPRYGVDDHSQPKINEIEVVSKKSLKKQTIDKSKNKEFKSTTEEVFTTSSSAGAAKLRFTQISDIIRQQKARDEQEKQPSATALQSRYSRGQKSPTKSVSRPKQAGFSRTYNSPVETKSRSPSSSPQQTRTSRIQTSSSEPRSKSPIPSLQQAGTSRKQKSQVETKSKSPISSLRQAETSHTQKSLVKPKSKSPISLRQAETSHMQKSPVKPKSKSPISSLRQADTSHMQKSSVKPKSKSPISSLRQAETSHTQKSPVKPKSKSPISSLRQAETSHMQKSAVKPKSKSPTSGSLPSGTSTVSKSKPKSPIRSRPVSTNTTTTGPKSSSTLQSQQNVAGRVQFYDYNNKFHKQYVHPPSAVEMHDTSTENMQMNAMEQALFEEELRTAKDDDMENLRQRSSERCQKAIEREQVRRACDDLTAKLDAVTKQRQILQCDSHQFSSLRLGQVAADKEMKRNKAVEDILQRPAVITCPTVDHKQSESKPSFVDNPRTHARDLNLGSALSRDEISLNSSDSCCSILLGYVNGHSKQIADDIKKYNEQNGETHKGKAEKLQNLLTRINRLRECLMRELEKCSISAASDRERIQTMMDSIGEFRKEHENILIDDASKDSISKREEDLKKKEAILENKLREFYEIQKAAKKKTAEKKAAEEVEENRARTQKPPHTEESEKMEPEEKRHEQNKTLIKDKKPINVIYAKDKIKLQTSIMQKGVIREREIQEILLSSEAESDDEEEEEILERRQVLTGENPVEIIIKVQGDKSKKIKKIPSKSPRRLCTTIKGSSARKIRKKPSTARSIESNSTSYRSLPPTIQNNVDKLLKDASVPLEEPTTSKAQGHLQIQQEKKTTRQGTSNLNPLMAHYVQRLLGMSRTSISALGVNSSDIDTPSSSIVNITSNLSAADTEKLAASRLEHVQTFLEDNYSFIDELEESLRQSSSTDSSLKTLEVIWKKALDEQKSKKNSMLLETQREKPTKSALKKPKKQKSHEDKLEVSSIDKSTKLAESCNLRIAELTKLINKVRQEKQKILETTLSSASENGRNSTEYLDLPERRNNSEESSSRILYPQSTTETAPQLEKNKQTGISRDSGISLSRPITVQEMGYSPTEDFRRSQTSTESLTSQVTKPKPPISIERYSPQLVEDIPHELSTIFEVDTPATSRINTSLTNNGKEFIPHQVQNQRPETITYKKFPTFEEYARLNQLDMSQFDPEFSMQFEKEFNEFMNLAREGKVNDYQQFTSFSKYFPKSSSGDDKEAAVELLTSLKLANLSFKKFPTRKEYLQKIGVSASDLLDSQSLDNVDESRGHNSHSSSIESLMNIEKELKLRNILTKSFRQNATPDNRSSSPNKFSEENGHRGNISGISHLFMGGTSSDTDNLETELKKLGIDWPSIMKKKTIQTQALSVSTSSGSLNVRRKPQTVKTSFQKETRTTYEKMDQTEDGGRQLNLREFLTKELLKRTNTSSSFSFSDDSVASSILRSIIGSISSPLQQQQGGVAQGIDRQKTSTPMASHSTSSGSGSKSQEGVSSVHFFSGDSRLSSVHLNNTPKDGKM